MLPFDRAGFQDWRKWATWRATGRVLEIGAGTGLNFPYYPSEAAVIAFDPDPGMLETIQLPNPGAAKVNLVLASVQDLPFADSSFDSAVGTLVMCTIPDPQRALSEVRRVMKKGAPFRLVEHVR